MNVIQRYYRELFSCFLNNLLIHQTYSVLKHPSLHFKKENIVCKHFLMLLKSNNNNKFKKCDEKKVSMAVPACNLSDDAPGMN